MATIDASLPVRNSYPNRATRRDKHRRRRWQQAVTDLLAKRKISRGAKVAAESLARRSDDTAKLVWGHQSGYAELSGCSVRQFQRNVKELEEIGMIEVDRCAPEQMPDGRVARARTNRYKFCVPLGKVRQKSRSFRHDTSVAKDQQTTFIDKTSERSSIQVLLEPPGEDHELPAWLLERRASRAFG